MSINVHFKQLEVFLALHELGSFTEAAERLHMAQPSLSYQLKQLEYYLGTALFERTTRRVILTAAGRLFLPTAEQIVRQMTKSIGDIKALAFGASGRVSFTALLAEGASLVPAAMSAFHARYPDIQLNYVEEGDEPIGDQILRGDIDFGIGVRPPYFNANNIHFAELYRDYLYCTCALDHPLAQQEQVSWFDIVKYPFIVMERNSCLLPLIEQGFALAQTTLTPEHKVHYQSTALGMVANNMGITVMPASLQFLYCRSDVKLVPIREDIYREVGILTDDRRSLALAAKRFTEMIHRIVVEDEALLPPH